MNHALFLQEEEKEEVDTSLEEARLIRLIEAIARLFENSDWRTLVELHFSQEEERVKRLLLAATMETPLPVEQIYRLQGELKWARRYKNLALFAHNLKKQLNQLRKQDKIHE